MADGRWQMADGRWQMADKKSDEHYTYCVRRFIYLKIFYI